ncbi:hypothetical protein LV84_00780 [Algoriphagus ratkowskyi]|uniref:Uncharacterized protein n=1 Tax=Algoriphagus ratkowskyi TaxID=57028 RepID=A0A2W7T8N9_9BACT|nr:hypothetical protein [Algoriphagus ratkowskyi]PZX59572.1 hypothetical protein LV84_00780 [Algoriphagus ratkowskyi]TXD78703.1 hypothetical protein ESW18_07900 [Algoriphagus ratkowskyi]
MPLTPLTPRPSFEENPTLAKAADNLSTLITAIELKKIPRLQEQKINEIVAGVNKFAGPDAELLKQFKSAQAAIIKLLEQELKLVPQNHYQLQWLVLGMAAFGIPIGIAFGLALGNLAFLGIGLPIGMGIGIAVGTAKDKKAKDEGRQLDWVAK